MRRRLPESDRQPLRMDPDTVDIWIQLGVGGTMVALTTVAHGLGLIGITKLFRLKDERLEAHEFDYRAVALMSVIPMSLFVLHALEIALFSAVYMTIGAIGSVEEALFYSASAYATLGYTADYFPDAWRLLGSMEALVGFLLLGWSTAFLVHNFNKLQG